MNTGPEENMCGGIIYLWIKEIITSFKIMDVTPDLPFLIIHNPFTNERISLDLLGQT